MNMKCPVVDPAAPSSMRTLATPEQQAALPSGAIRSGGPRTSAGPRTLDSHELLGDQAMVLIRHLGELYRLQTTRQGKLILTK
jgi:hemin uptake protein HemP